MGISVFGRFVMVKIDGGPSAFEVLPAGVSRPDEGWDVTGGYFLFGGEAIAVDFNGNLYVY